MKACQWLLAATSFLVGCGRVEPPVVEIDEPAAEAQAGDADRPFLAIWRHDDGFVRESKAPYLRIAIWNDGRVLFAKDASKWGHDLRKGQITAKRIDQLKKALLATGVFELKGNCYLVPSAPHDCVMLDLGNKRQMLYWDEVETPGYGINTNPKPNHRKFKECWKAVNQLALAARPEKSEEEKERFQRPPDAWFLKKKIQSE